MKRLRIALATTALVAGGAFAAPAAASSPTYYISQSGGAAGIGNGSSCAAPDVIVDNAGVYFNDAMNQVLADLDTSANTTIVICASATEYEMDGDTDQTDFNVGDGSQTLTIRGSSGNRADTVIDGGDSQSPIQVTDVNLAISNLIMVDTYDGTEGSAIDLQSSDDTSLRLTLNNVSVRSSYADDYGTVYVDGDLVASNVSFEDNYAWDWGGAIYVEGDATIVNSNFEGNESETDEGGAVYVNGDVSISKSRFVSNESDDEGGAIFIYGSARISASHFEDNWTDDDDGGAVEVRNALTVTGSTFINNEADSEGGAINAQACDRVIISGNTFIENNADSSGGAVNIDGNCDGDENNRDVEITFLRNKFLSNSADGGAGGAVDIDHGYTTVLFRSNRFESNTALNSTGGAIWLNYARLLGNSFAGNSAVCGGAVYVDEDIFGTQKFNGFRNNSALEGSRVRNIGTEELCFDAFE